MRSGANGCGAARSEALAAELVTAIEALPVRITASVRTVRRDFSRRLKSADAGTVIDIALDLLKEPDRDHRWVAYELIQHHSGAAAQLNGPLLKRLGGELGSWDAVDTFACDLSGRAWRAGQIPDTLIHRWTGSPSRWWRRAALVSTVPLNMKSHGGSGDAARTLAVCRLLIDDRDDMVVKAMSWALRTLAERDPGAVRDFLAEHESRLAARVLREVRNKLNTGLKNPGKTGRSSNPR